MPREAFRHARSTIAATHDITASAAPPPVLTFASFTLQVPGTASPEIFSDKRDAARAIGRTGGRAILDGPPWPPAPIAMTGGGGGQGLWGGL